MSGPYIEQILSHSVTNCCGVSLAENFNTCLKAEPPVLENLVPIIVIFPISDA